jgi:iron complex transport system substrate-binding protein
MGTLQHGLRRGLSRRALIAAAPAGLFIDRGRTAGAQDIGTPAAGTWTFTDDRGETISLSSRPERIVAFSPVAAVWDFGLRPVGVFGPFRRADGSPDPQIGEVDLDAVVHLGDYREGGFEFDLEKLVALAPDLLAGLSLPDVPNTIWYVPEEAFGTVESLVPTLGLGLSGRSALEQIVRIEELATALGADLDRPEVVAHRQEFEAAEAELSDQIAEQEGLTVLVISAGADAAYVANPSWFGDLQYFQDLGLSFVEPETDERWETLSWEQIGRYRTDLILVDARNGDIPYEILDPIATWRTLPAVQDGQVGPWRAVYPYGRRAFTEIMREVTDLLRQADASVVA